MCIQRRGGGEGDAKLGTERWGQNYTFQQMGGGQNYTFREMVGAKLYIQGGGMGTELCIQMDGVGVGMVGGKTLHSD